MCLFLLSLLLFFLSGSKTQTPERTMVDITYYSHFMVWGDAQTHCRKYHTDLITIRSERDNQRFSKAHGWIGLFRENARDRWKWSHGDEAANYHPWAEHEPKKDQHCGTRLDASGEWWSDRCEDKHSFTCYDEKLVLVRENKTWEEALAHCRSLRGGNTNKPPTRRYLYDLASLITKDDHVTARERVQAATTDEVWTGLRFLAGHWWWADQEPMLYEDVDSCPTDRSCGAIEKTGTAQFATRDCLERRNFLCYKWA